MDGVMTWEQFLSAIWRGVISELCGEKGNLKNPQKEISQSSLSVKCFLLVNIPGAKVKIMRSHVSLGPRPIDGVVLCRGYCNSIVGCFSSWASQCRGDLLRT